MYEYINLRDNGVARAQSYLTILIKFNIMKK